MQPGQQTPPFDEPERWPATPTKKPHYVAIALLAVLIAVVAYNWSDIRAFVHHLDLPSEAIVWKTDLPAAIAESQKTGKPVLVYFTASSDPSCQTMNRDVWADAKVRKLAVRFVPVLMDADLASTPPVAQQYGVRTIPHIVLLDSQGTVTREGSAMGRGEMIQFMELALPY